MEVSIAPGGAGAHLELTPGLLNGHSPVHAMLHGHVDLSDQAARLQCFAISKF